MAALRSSDGAFLLGVMGGHTATAGQIYFAAGTPDPNDIVGDTVDLDGGVMRELTEETGLGLADVERQDGWTATPLGQRIALMKIVQARETADRAARTHLCVPRKPGSSRSLPISTSCAASATCTRTCRPLWRLPEKPLRLGLPRRVARRELTP